MGKAYKMIGGNSAAIQSWENATQAARSSCDLISYLLMQELIRDCKKSSVDGVKQAQVIKKNSTCLKPSSPNTSSTSSTSILELEMYHKKFIGKNVTFIPYSVSHV